MMLPSRVIDLMPQKNLVSDNSIVMGSGLGQTNSLLGESKDPISNDRFKDMISDLLGNELIDTHGQAREYLPGEQREQEGEAPQALPVEGATRAPLKIDKQVNILASSAILLSLYQAVPILKTTDLQSYPTSGLENHHASPGELYPKGPTLKGTPIGEQSLLNMSDPKIVGKAELLPFEEPGAASPLKHDVEGLIDHLFIKDLSARIEGGIISSANLREGSSFALFHNNPAREEEGPYTFSISRNRVQEMGESSRQLFFGTKLTGEEGDIKNKPNLDKELRLFFHYNSGNGEDFRNILTNNRDHTSNKISVNSHINISDSQPLNKIQDLFFQVAAHRAKEDTNSISINIDRDDLGRLKLDISVRDNMVKAEIVTEYPRVKEIIELNQGQLRDALSDHGLEMSYLSVSVEGGQSDSLNYQGMAKDQSTTHNHHDIVIPEEDNDLICRVQCKSDSSISIFA